MWMRPNLTFFAVTVVVAMSDLIVKQERNIDCLGIIVLRCEFRYLFLECTSVLFGKGRAWDLDFVPS